DENVTLYHGDCLEQTAWLDADVLVTDPPYGVAWTTGQTSRAKVPLVEKIAGDEDAAARDHALALWGSSPAIVFGSWRVDRPAGVSHRLIWHKARRKPGFSSAPWFPNDEEVYIIAEGCVGAARASLITTHEQRDGANGEVAKNGHPTPKPLSLMEQLISKCPPGVLADPFAGSGSTLVAARNLGRKCIGAETEETYCEIIAKRLDQYALDFGGVS